MLPKVAGFSLALAIALPAFAQDATPIEIAIQTCIGPGYIPDGDPYEVLDGLDERYCKRACRASERGCKSVARAIDRCGINFLKASAKVSTQICRGWGYSAQECRRINAELKADIDWWKAQGRIERDECDREADTNCSSRCQPVEASLYEGLVPGPSLEIRPGETEDAETGGAIEYLDLEAGLQMFDSHHAPQGEAGSGVRSLPEENRLFAPPGSVVGVVE